MKCDVKADIVIIFPHIAKSTEVLIPQFSFFNLGLQIFLTLWETNLLYLRIIFHLKFLFFQ